MKNIVIATQSGQWQEYYGSIFPAADIRVVTGGVDSAFFIPARNKVNADDVVKILYVGWLIEAKGIYDLFQALKILRTSGLKFQLEMVGPLYDEVEKVEDYLLNADINKLVSITGSIYSRDALRDKYQAADIFIFPSHFEGFPVALLEAMSCGLPCIGTDIGGIPDILDRGETGLVVNKQSPDQLAEALKRLISDKKLRDDFGRRANHKVLNDYTFKESMRSYRTLLEIT